MALEAGSSWPAGSPARLPELQSSWWDLGPHPSKATAGTALSPRDKHPLFPVCVSYGQAMLPLFSPLPFSPADREFQLRVRTEGPLSLLPPRAAHLPESILLPAISHPHLSVNELIASF